MQNLGYMYVCIFITTLSMNVNGQTLVQSKNGWGNCKVTDGHAARNEIYTVVQEAMDDLMSKYISEVSKLKKDISTYKSKVSGLEKDLNGTESPNRCPPGWIKHSQSCYFFSIDKEPWALASAHCTALGSHLVRINSADEDSFVKATLKARKPYTFVWIDGTDIAKEGHWVYGKSQTQFVYKGWQKGGPDQWRDQDCLCMDARSGYKWNDGECFRAFQFVCERNSSF